MSELEMKRRFSNMADLTSVNLRKKNSPLELCSKSEKECETENVQSNQAVCRTVASKSEFSNNEDLFLEDILKLIPKPPDGGYGWIILLSCFLMNAIVGGVKVVSGVFADSYVYHYNATIAQISWITSLSTAISNFGGPLYAAILNVYGFRFTAILGSLISVIALLLSIISPCVEVLIVFAGLFTGLGLGFIQMSAIVCPGFYFTKRRNFACGINQAGIPVGMAIIPPIVDFLLQEYCWQGSTLIVSGLMLNCFAFAALLRPLELISSPETLKIPQSSGGRKEKKLSVVLKIDSDEMQFPNKSTNCTNMINHLGCEPGNFTCKSTVNERNNLIINDKTSTRPERKNSDILLSKKQNKESGAYMLDEIKNDFMSNNTSYYSSRKSLDRVKSVPENCCKEKKWSLAELPLADIRNKPSEIISRWSKITKLNVADKSLLFQSRRKSVLLQSVPRRSVQVNNDVSVFNNVSEKNVRRFTVDYRDLNKPIYRKDSFFCGSIQNLPEFRNSVVDIDSYLANVTCIPLTDESLIDNNAHKSLRSETFLKLPPVVLDILNELSDVSVFLNMKYLLLCFSNIFSCTAFFLPVLYMNKGTMESDVKPNEVAVLISLLGIGNGIGRIFLGWLCCFPQFSPTVAYNFCLLLAGIAMISMSFTYSFIMMALAVFCYGFFFGGPLAITPSILIEILGLDKFSQSFGKLSLFKGIGLLIGPPLAAMVLTRTNNGASVFCFGGSCTITACLINIAGSYFKYPRIKKVDVK